jgi:glycerate kinase
MPGRGVVCCPDSFKGVLSAADAAAALAGGFRAAGIEAVELPLADGGEGTADALSFRGGEWRTATVTDPLGRPVEARFLLRGDGVAVVEAAEAVGLWRLAPDELDPIRASSRGLGELLLAAVAAGARRIIVALGGTATVDGGLGMREVLDRLPVPVTAACDVRNPLLGRRGAARAFGPQKGATPVQVEELERRLAAIPELAPVAALAGAGSAGGLGAAFAALGAELVAGIDLVLREVDFDGILASGVRLVVTGEGGVDASSAEGKVPAGVATACAGRGIACVVAGGTVAPGAEPALYELGATAVLRLGGRPERTRDDLAACGEALGRLLTRLAFG